MQSATGMSVFAKTLKCTCTNITNCLCAVYKFMLDVTVSACVVRNLLNDDRVAGRCVLVEPQKDKVKPYKLQSNPVGKNCSVL